MNDVGAALETERLLLRELRPDDFDAVHAYGSDPEVVEFVPWGPNTEQETRDFINNTVADQSEDPRVDWVYAIVPRDEGRVIDGSRTHDHGRLVGTVGLYLRPSDPGQAMLGYALAPEAWGRGYATEASRTMITFAFDVLDLRRVWAACDPDNTGSIRVLEKAGLALEGRLRGDTIIRGRVRDTLVWGILRDEWRR
jgi:[ribosomal protein S5]-alanine N-acetyltransferase